MESNFIAFSKLFTENSIPYRVKVLFDKNNVKHLILDATSVSLSFNAQGKLENIIVNN